MGPTLEDSYEYCKNVAKTQAKNFYVAFLTLPKEQRYGIFALYAFCRMCDDIADKEGPLQGKRARLSKIDLSLKGMKEGRAEGKVLTALADTTNNFSIPLEYYDQVVEGVSRDLDLKIVSTFEDLKRYCYGVASVIGLICLRIFGVPKGSAECGAIQMGYAMQLTNILRDLDEDQRIGRVYIPLEDLSRFDYSLDDLWNHRVNDSFLRLMSFEIFRIKEYFEQSQQYFHLIPPRSRMCPQLLHSAYSTILKGIEKDPGQVFSRKIRLTKNQKLVLALRLCAHVFLHPK